MLLALLVYLFCALSGWAFERRFPINSLIKRSLIFLAAASAQLMISVQVLSLFRALTIPYLVFANLAFSVILLALSRKRLSPQRLPWAQLASQRWNEVRSTPKDFLTLALAACGTVFLALGIVSGWFLFILNDTYHYEMPRLWMQHASILPFPFPNSRAVALSPLSEILQLPGYMARLERISVLATLLTSALALGVIFSLARRIGASLPAAASAAAVSLGSCAFAFNLYASGVDMVLQAVCVGGSLIFLMDFASNRSRSNLTFDLGASIFLFVMACGAKNSAMLLAPFYLVFLAAACWKHLNSPESRPAFLRKFTATAMVAGIAGLLFTGVAWNNIANKIWFGSKGLPLMLRETLAQDFGPREIWTRICRGAVQIAADTLYVPRSIKPRYEAAAHRAVTMLGGKNSLPEDNKYYSFQPAPFRGLGLVGTFLLFPAIVFAIVRATSALKSRPLNPAAWNAVILVAMATAAFLITHVVLRWQAIGLIRLMFPFVIIAGALTATLLEKKAFRFLALALLSATTLVYSVFWAGHVARRHDWTDKPILSKIARLQNPHSYMAKVQRKDQPPSEVFVREDYSLSPLVIDFLNHSTQPAVIGFIGHGNSAAYDLFGDRSQNKVIALVDCRDEDTIMEPPRDIDYVVADEYFSKARVWADAHGFEETAAYSNDEKELFVTFVKRSK